VKRISENFLLTFGYASMLHSLQIIYFELPTLQLECVLLIEAFNNSLYIISNFRIIPNLILLSEKT